MAYAPQRSMNGSLTDGMTEGTYKTRNTNRGGFVEDTSELARDDLYPVNYSIAEDPFKESPDGTARMSTGNRRYRPTLRHEG